MLETDIYVKIKYINNESSDYMRQERRILMCLQQLDIGGVETAVLTLCKGYVRAGHKVFVAAKDGIFREQLEKIGVEFLELDYKIVNNYVLDEKEKLIDYCKNNNITEIHIHQYPCVIYWLPVIMELKIPYVAYVHSIIPGAPEWFMKTFPVYKTALPIFFENASKIVCISEKTRKDIDCLFNLNKSKYLVVPNSLNMEDFKQTSISKTIQTFGILSRLSEEKEKAIEKAIDLFCEFSKNKDNVKLLIAGDGNIKSKIEQKIKHNKKIKLIGKVSNPGEFLKTIDVYMGVDRTVLEALASNRLTIITNYNGGATLITKDNIELASQENFSGNNLNNEENVVEIISKLKEREIRKIVAENYEFINKKYNVDNHLYNDILMNNYTNDYNQLFKIINEYMKEIDNQNNLLNSLEQQKLSVRIKRFIKRVINKIKRTFQQ